MYNAFSVIILGLIDPQRHTLHKNISFLLKPLSDVHVHTITRIIYCFNGHYQGKPGLTSFPIDFQPPKIPILSILTGQAKTLHIPFDTISTCLSQMSSLLGSLNLHLNINTSYTGHQHLCKLN